MKGNRKCKLQTIVENHVFHKADFVSRQAIQIIIDYYLNGKCSIKDKADFA